MEFVATPEDLQRMAAAAGRIDKNPVRLAGRVLGLGAEEQSAGIPGWAWYTLIFAAGAWAGVALAPQIRSYMQLD